MTGDADATWTPRRRRLAVVAVAPLLGLSVAGLVAHTLLYRFGTVPVPFVVFGAVVVGAVLARWTRTLGEAIAAVGVAAATALAGAAWALAWPPIAAGGLSTAAANAIVVDAVSRAFVFVGLASVLVAFGMVVTTVLEQEVFEGTAPTQQLAAVTLAVVLVSVALGGTVVVNYAAATDARDATAAVDRVRVVDDEVRAFVAVPGALNRELTVESIVVEVSVDGDRVTGRRVTGGTVPPGQWGVFRVTLPAEDVFGERDRVEATVTGYVYVSAYNGYEARFTIEPRTVVLSR